MIPHDIILRRQMINRMLNICSDNEDKLTNWENNFIQSIDEQFSKKKDLSEAQCDSLEKIYNKCS